MNKRIQIGLILVITLILLLGLTIPSLAKTKAPFDIIIVTAAALEIPPSLLNQLALGGRLVMPIGPVGEEQDLTIIMKSESGEITKVVDGKVRFVPMTGEIQDR